MDLPCNKNRLVYTDLILKCTLVNLLVRETRCRPRHFCSVQYLQIIFNISWICMIQLNINNRVLKYPPPPPIYDRISLKLTLALKLFLTYVPKV